MCFMSTSQCAEMWATSDTLFCCTGDDAKWTNFNDSQLTPLIPNAIMWLVAEAEEQLRNDTWLDLNLALDMSRLQSVAYCHPPNVAAWNCTR